MPFFFFGTFFYREGGVRKFEDEQKNAKLYTILLSVSVRWASTERGRRFGGGGGGGRRDAGVVVFVPSRQFRLLARGETQRVFVKF